MFRRGGFVNKDCEVGVFVMIIHSIVIHLIGDSDVFAHSDVNIKTNESCIFSVQWFFSAHMCSYAVSVLL